MSLHERIKQKLDEKNLKAADLARATKKSAVSAKKWLDGVSVPTAENLKTIAKFLGVTDDWLLFGGKEQQTVDNNVSNKPARLAPVLSWVQAGTFTNVQAVDMSQVEEWLPLPEECTNCFYLKVQGISNQPDFLEGDYILVDPDVYYSDMQSGDMVVVRKFEDATFKKLVIETDGSRYMQALNPNFQPNIIPLDEHCHFVGQVVDCMRYTYRAKRRTRPNHS
ncbi:MULTISPECIES: LexA family protein [Acinetobacter]|uniref:Helix-turn-helix domain-containing protein n=1 Tax=Acinetobacter courvalinii TaxID=280147 RepID=A0AA42LD99_9GAMM|nr:MULTISPECIES: S24 family peptidase [Acinetobacter]MDH0562177.1 helix-turn-helix domain-containing protein [Acinetobacter courvalinii]RSN81541.1 helix-turn-helix domain-containing protein [Acinetobacter baumannii]